MPTQSCLLLCLREAEARVLRRLMKVRAAQSVFAADPKHWLQQQLCMEIARVAQERAMSGVTLRFEDIDRSAAFQMRASTEAETQIYGPVLWHMADGPAWDVLTRRGVGYVLRHTDLL